MILTDYDIDTLIEAMNAWRNRELDKLAIESSKAIGPVSSVGELLDKALKAKDKDKDKIKFIGEEQKRIVGKLEVIKNDRSKING